VELHVVSRDGAFDAIAETYFPATLLLRYLNTTETTFTDLFIKLCVKQVTVADFMKHVAVGTDNDDSTTIEQIDTGRVTFAAPFQQAAKRIIAHFKTLEPDQLKALLMFWTGVPTPAFEGMNNTPGYDESGMRLMFTEISALAIHVQTCFNRFQINATAINACANQAEVDDMLLIAYRDTPMQDATD
jgi:hypothetical protein